MVDFWHKIFDNYGTGGRSPIVFNFFSLSVYMTCADGTLVCVSNEYMLKKVFI